MNTNLMKLLFCVVAVFMTLSVYGQGLTVKSVTEDIKNIKASVDERPDGNGKPCALIKIEVPSLKGLSFDGSVGITEYNSGVYYVYTSPGIARLSVLNNNKKVCDIDFAAHNIQIESKHTYVVELAELVREKIFMIEPANASLTVDGKAVELVDGVGKFTCDAGVTYHYTLTADGYIQKDGEFTYSDEEGGHEPLDVLMERKIVPVTFRCNVEKFEVIVDDGDPHPMVNNGGTVYIPVGSTAIRVRASKYDDWEQTAMIQDDGGSTINVTLKKSSSVSDEFRDRMGLVVSGGLAIPFGADKYGIDNATGYPIKVGAEYEHFFKRWFTFRTGVEFFYYAGNDMKMDDKHPFAFDIPLVFNVNVPLGRLNRNFFTVGIGPVFGLGSFFDSSKDDDSTAAGDDSADDSDDTKFLAGGRVEARLIVRKFMIGATIDYHYCKDVIKGDGMILPMVTLGYRF